YLPPRLFLVTLNSAVSPLLVVLGDMLFGLPVGVAAAVAWAFWPMSIHYSFSSDRLMAEPLAIPLFAAAVALVVRGCVRASTRSALAGGALLGYAVLTRGHVGPSVPLIALAIVVAAAPLAW